MDLHCLHDLAWFLCLQKMKRLTVSDCELALSPSLPVHPHSTHLTLIITSWADWATVPFWAWGSSWSSHNYVHREGNGLYPFNVLPVLSFSFPPPPPPPPQKRQKEEERLLQYSMHNTFAKLRSEENRFVLRRHTWTETKTKCNDIIRTPHPTQPFPDHNHHLHSSEILTHCSLSLKPSLWKFSF